MKVSSILNSVKETTKKVVDSVNNAVDNFVTPKLKALYQGSKDYLETDSRGIGVQTTLPTKDGSGAKVNFIEIPTPAWFPDSFLRSSKRNNYLNMVNNSAYLGTANDISSANNGSSLDFYKEDSGNIVRKLVTTGVKSIVSTAGNQLLSVSSKIDSAIDGIGSLFSSGGGDVNLEKAINDVKNEPFVMAQPYVEIYGIHLTDTLREAIFAVSKAIGAAMNVFGEFGNVETYKHENSELKTKLMAKWTKIADYAKKTIYNMCKWDAQKDLGSQLVDLFQTPEYRMHSFAEKLLECTVAGTYTMKCKLPYISHSDNSPIMKSWGTHGFNYKYIMSGGDLDQGILSGLSDHWGMNGVWTRPIMWKPYDVSVDNEVLKMNFDIFNDTLEHTLLNLMFIWSFGATTKAVTDTFFLRPPYLYSVDIPGGFRYKYCVCGFSVAPRGKMRRISQSASGSNDAMQQIFKKVFKYDVNPSAISYVPDYYNVQISFTSILPDTWNFMDSYLTQRDDSKIQLGQDLRTKMAELSRGWQKS